MERIEIRNRGHAYVCTRYRVILVYTQERASASSRRSNDTRTGKARTHERGKAPNSRRGKGELTSSTARELSPIYLRPFLTQNKTTLRWKKGMVRLKYENIYHYYHYTIKSRLLVIMVKKRKQKYI